MTLHMELKERGYDITVERGVLARIGTYFSLNRRVLILTDSGVPTAYAETVAAACKTPVVVRIPMGEQSKCFSVYERVLSEMLAHHFDRTDCVVAVGGGVVGDLAGFVAATYMRGIDFYNVPTTLLSQVDSSIGGKVAIDLGGVKNIVGAFYQPRSVLIDPDTLSTLPSRQIAAGLAEALKMALTSDAILYEIFKKGQAEQEIDTVIERALRIKKAVVEEDERENGIRRILNFGHTLGHGIETAAKGSLLHGECVALGMLPMCDGELCTELKEILRSLGLPTRIEGNLEEILTIASHDKKRDDAYMNVVRVHQAGSFEMIKQDLEEWKADVRLRIPLING